MTIILGRARVNCFLCTGVPAGRHRVQGHLFADRFGRLHGAGFWSEQIDLHMDLYANAEGQVIRAYISAQHTDTGHNKQTVTPVLLPISSSFVADLCLHDRRCMMTVPFPVDHNTTHRNGYQNVVSHIRTVSLHRRPPGLRTALLHPFQSVRAAGAGRQPLKGNLCAKIRDGTFFTAYDFLQQNVFAAGLPGLHGQLSAYHTAVVGRGACFYWPGPIRSLVHRVV